MTRNYVSSFSTQTYIDIMARKPLLLRIAGYHISVPPLTVEAYIRLNGECRIIIQNIEKIKALVGHKADAMKIAYLGMLIHIFYGLTKKSVFFLKRPFYRYALHKAVNDDVHVLFNALDILFRHNEEVKKKAHEIQDRDPWAFNAQQTIGGKPLSDYIRTNESGEKCFMPRHSQSLKAA